jgi:hypothetical protein
MLLVTVLYGCSKRLEGFKKWWSIMLVTVPVTKINLFHLGFNFLVSRHFLNPLLVAAFYLPQLYCLSYNPLFCRLARMSGIPAKPVLL